MDPASGRIKQHGSPQFNQAQISFMTHLHNDTNQGNKQASMIFVRWVNNVKTRDRRALLLKNSWHKINIDAVRRIRVY